MSLPYFMALICSALVFFSSCKPGVQTQNPQAITTPKDELPTTTPYWLLHCQKHKLKGTFEYRFDALWFVSDEQLRKRKVPLSDSKRASGFYQFGHSWMPSEVFLPQVSKKGLVGVTNDPDKQSQLVLFRKDASHLKALRFDLNTFKEQPLFKLALDGAISFLGRQRQWLLFEHRKGGKQWFVAIDIHDSTKRLTTPKRAFASPIVVPKHTNQPVSGFELPIGRLVARDSHSAYTLCGVPRQVCILSTQSSKLTLKQTNQPAQWIYNTEAPNQFHIVTKDTTTSHQQQCLLVQSTASTTKNDTFTLKSRACASLGYHAGFVMDGQQTQKAHGVFSYCRVQSSLHMADASRTIQPTLMVGQQSIVFSGNQLDVGWADVEGDDVAPRFGVALDPDYFQITPTPHTEATYTIKPLPDLVIDTGSACFQGMMSYRTHSGFYEHHGKQSAHPEGYEEDPRLAQMLYRDYVEFGKCE